MSNFTLTNNEKIRRYFASESDDAPTGELVYLHTRPLLRPNFIYEIEDLVNKVGTKFVNHGIKGKPMQDLERIAIVLGQNADGVMTEDKAKPILEAMRELYKLCTKYDALLD